MADISKSDIKLMASQVLADTEDGGGQMTSNEIVSGNVNNLFPDISRLDRTYGRVSMRKAYISVQTDNRSTYYGSHVALTEQAKDPLVNTTLFTTKDWFDKRESCRNRIEGYLVKGPIYACALWGDHYAGSRAITVFTEEGWKLPENGEVFVLIKTKDLNGATVTREEQFLRITKIESEVREFDDGNSKYKKQIITINFGDKIKFDLLGSSPTRAFTYGVESRGTVIHTSVVADTSSYYGVSALKEPAVQGSLGIRVDEIRKPLVPSTTSQAAVTDFTVGNLREALVPATGADAGKVTINRSVSYSSGNSNQLVIGTGLLRGSLELNLPGLGNFTDNSKGDLLNEASAIAGTVDYKDGTITFSASSSNSGTAVVKIHPAVAVSAFTETGKIKIQEQNRGYVYVFNCTPSPMKGSIKIDYLSSGKWYSLYDQGTGELKGLEDGIGSGTVNFTTGSVSLTLGGMPDVNSDILIYWSTPVFTSAWQDWLKSQTERFSEYNFWWLGSFTAIQPPVILKGTAGQYSSVKAGQEIEFSFTLAEGSYRIYGTYPSWGDLSEEINEKNALTYEYIDTEGTVVSGVCGGLYKNGLDVCYYFSLRDFPGNPSSAEYTINTVTTETVSGTVSSDHAETLNYDIGGDIRPGTLSGKLKIIADQLDYDTTYTILGESIGWWHPHATRGSKLKMKSDSAFVEFYDNGAGKLLWQGDNSEIGTVDYSTGAVTLQGNYTAGFQADQTAYSQGQYICSTVTTESVVTVEQAAKYEANSDIEYSYEATTAASTSNQVSVAVSEMDSAILVPVPSFASFIPGSVNFVYDTKFYRDTGLGTIVSDSSDQVFSVNYNSGEITAQNNFNPLPLGEANLLWFTGSLIQNRKEVVYQWVFRTPGAPVTPSSFTIQATTDDGQVIDATGDFDGIVESNEIHGTIEYSTGIVNVKFGVWAAIPEGQETAEWLNDFDVEGSNYLKPLAVQTSTIVMNCVVETYVPLDATLLGLSPVKLPLDGRVPIFRDGDIVLIHHSETDVISSPTAGQVVSLSRQNVNLIELYDNNGVYIPELGNYSVDLVAGEITFEDPLDLSAYSSPFQAVNRIEDMVLATDVQITGHMTLSQPLQHDYPADETSVSSVLAIGDVQARIYNIFTDSSWGDVWQDTRKYSPTSAQYDTVNYPLITKNKSSVKERFACVFTSSNTVNVLGKHLGVILTNAPITADIAPVNPATGEPYFTIRYEGWGSGWSSGQVLRFNCDAGNFPVWFCRTTQQGPATENSDNYVIQVRGDSS
jgi:hypothetical protein